MNYPNFGIGQTDGVASYCQQVFPRLCENTGISESDRQRLFGTFFKTVMACSSSLGSSLNQPMTQSLPEGRELIQLIAELLVSKESTLSGKEHLDEAFEFMAQGGNVLLVQNHRSGADSLVMEGLMHRNYDKDCTKDWVYMSGHAVNLYLLPYLISSGFNRAQIFSKKYQSMAAQGNGVLQDTGANEEKMRAQNLRALSSLGKYAQDGGKLVVLYPEGGRGEGEMKNGEQGTVAIPEILAKRSPHGLAVLPTFVDNATSILPVRRTANEYNEFLEHVTKGTGHMTVGPLVPWNTIDGIATGQADVQDRLSNLLPFEVTADGKIAERNRKIGLIMSLIAEAAPNEQEMGAYKNPELRGFVSDLLERAH